MDSSFIRMGMKTHLAVLLGLVLCLASVSSARYTPWAAGSEYIYRLHAVSVSDIPELSSQAASVKFDSQLIVQCRDAGSIIVKLVDVIAWKYHSDVEERWNEFESTHSGTKVNIEGKYFLEKPFIIRHREGLFESLVVSQDEPFWSINMKKAVASKLQLHVSGSRSIESASRNFGLLDDLSEDVNAVFKVFESGVTGECETLYEIAPLSDALIRSDSKLNPMPKRCLEGTFFQVVKTKDYSKCRLNKPVYNVVAPSGWQCMPGSAACGSARLRSSVSRYIACGSLESFTLLKITHQGEVRTSPYAYDTEQLRALSLLSLTLHAVRHASSYSSSVWAIKDLDNGVSIGSLVYSFPGSSASGSNWLSDGRMRTPQLREADQLHQGTEHTLEQIERLVSKAVDQIENSQEEAAVDTIAIVAHLIRHLDYQKISALLGEVGNHSTLERSVIMDAIVAAGSNPSVTFLKDSILHRRLSKSESLQAVAGFPLYIRTPTAELLNELFGMLKSLSTFTGLERSVYHSAMLSISQLAHIACVNASEARTRFPGGIYGDFCQPNDAFITSKLIPLLNKEVSGSGTLEDKIVALTALGEIGHESVLSVVLPIIKTKNTYPTVMRMKAVISLHKLAHDSNEKVSQILSTTYQNPTECSEVRMAAFSLLILANPPAYRWQRIAVSTWFEHSAQVVSFVYTTLHSLAKNIQPVANMKEISEKAQMVLPLAKPVPLGLKYSYNVKRSHMVPERNAGVEFHAEMFNSRDSIFPKSLYSRLSWILGPYHFDVFEFEAYGENWRSAWERIFAKFSSSSEGSEGFHNRNSGRFREFDLHPDLRRIKKQLNAKSPIPPQNAGSADAFFHLSLMKAIHHFTSFDEAGISDMIQSILTAGNVSIKREFSRRKWMPLTHAEVLIPNTLGFMITTQVQAQVLSSFKGEAQVVINGSSDLIDLKKWSTTTSTKNIGLELDIKPTVVVKVASSMSISAEFAKALSVSGVNTHVMVSLPGRLSLGVEIDSWKILASWKPASSGPAGLTTLYHYQVRPFTAMQATTVNLPFIPSSGDSKDVSASGVTAQTHQYPIGGNWGLMLNWISRSELPASANHGSVWQKSPAEILIDGNFALLPLSLHPQSYRLTLDAAASETTKIVFSLNLDAADKMDKGTQVFSSGSKSSATIKEPANRIQYRSNHMELHIKKKLTKVLNPVPKGSAIHVDAKLIMEKGGAPVKIYGASFAGAYGTEGTKLAVNAQLELPINQEVSDPLILCIEGGGQYPRFPSLDRATLIETDLEATWNANIGFGDSCTDHQIALDIGMKRSDEFARHVVNSPEYRDCVTHESRGEFSHEQCLAVKELSTLLDEYNVTVKYGHMVPVLKNATVGIESWLKSKFYSHLSENRVEVNNANKQLRVVAKVHPSLSSVDLKFFKPQSNTFFRDLPLSQTSNVVFPFSAKSSLTERLVDNTVSDGFAPICRLERSSITTFDKVQYNTQINECEHVVLAAPGIDNIAVLLRQDGDNKTVTLLVGRDKLEVSAAELKIRYNDMDVSVTEDQPLEVHQSDQANSRSTIGVYKIGPAAFRLSAHAHEIDISTDASSSVTIKAPRSFQGKMIGLCGNMDGETVSELRDSQRCILSSGALMAASYQLNENLQGKQCTKLPEKVRALLLEEQNTCHNGHDSLVHVSAPEPRQCIIQRTLVAERSFDKAKCFSTRAVQECHHSCYAVNKKATVIGFHCVTSRGEELEQEANHKILTVMFGKKEDIRTTRDLPTVCRPNSEPLDVSQ